MPRLNKISSHNTTVVPRDDGSVVVTLHRTEIVKVFPDRVELDTGGWLTTTTLTRMNQACNELNLGFSVSRAGGDLTARYWNTAKEVKSPDGRRLTLPRP